jgi:transcriptional regulator with XRE-family HTH domain
VIAMPKRDARAGNRLRLLRAEHRLTQIELARRLKVSQTTYWQLENGYRPASTRERDALARIFGVDASELGLELQRAAS